MDTYQLLTNAAATGDSVLVKRGRYAFAVSAGNFAGETISLESFITGEAWVGVSSAASFTANGQCEVALPDCLVRAAVTTGGGTVVTANASLSRIGD